LRSRGSAPGGRSRRAAPSWPFFESKKAKLTKIKNKKKHRTKYEKKKKELVK
jgi:hypothetical protein